MDELIIYTIFVNQTHFAVMRQIIERDNKGEAPPFDPHFQIVSQDLDLIRRMLHGIGLTRLDRHPSDDHRILESWL
jgi:hypothetical protein